jgi:hypothetical protein
MKIKITKDIPVGLFKGQLKEVSKNHGERLIKEGFAKEAKATDKDTYKKPIKAKKVVEEKVNENKCKGCGEVDEPCEDCEDKK